MRREADDTFPGRNMILFLYRFSYTALHILLMITAESMLPKRLFQVSFNVFQSSQDQPPLSSSA